MGIVHIAGWRDTQVGKRLEGPEPQDDLSEIRQQRTTHRVGGIIRGPVSCLHVDVLLCGPHPKTHPARFFGEHGPGLFHVVVANGRREYPGASTHLVGIRAALFTGNPHRPYLTCASFQEGR